MESWSCEAVGQWLKSIGCSEEVCNNFAQHEVDGYALKYLEKEELKEIVPALGVRTRIFTEKTKLEEKAKQAETVSRFSTDEPVEEQLRPFDTHTSLTFKYKHSALVPVLETRPDDLITPIHRFTDVNRMTRKTLEDVCRQTVLFACSCLNEHTNGTIHFGMKQNKITGMELEDDQKSTIEKQLTAALNDAFDPDELSIVRACVRPAKFIEVQQPASRRKRYVIEVDVKPASDLCGKEIFYVRAPRMEGLELVFGEPQIYRFSFHPCYRFDEKGNCCLCGKTTCKKCQDEILEVFFIVLDRLPLPYCTACRMACQSQNEVKITRRSCYADTVGVSFFWVISTFFSCTLPLQEVTCVFTL